MTVIGRELPRLYNFGDPTHTTSPQKAAMGRRRLVALMRSPARALDRLLVGKHRKLTTDAQIGTLEPIQSSVVMGSRSEALRHNL
jgi:hypothetical protein